MSQNAAIVGIVMLWCSNFLPLWIPTLGGGAYITSRCTPREPIHHWGDPAQPSTFQNKSLFGLTVFCQSSSLHGSTENISLPQFREEMCTPVSNIPLSKTEKDSSRNVFTCWLTTTGFWLQYPHVGLTFHSCQCHYRTDQLCPHSVCSASCLFGQY